MNPTTIKASVHLAFETYKCPTCGRTGCNSNGYDNYNIDKYIEGKYEAYYEDCDCRWDQSEYCSCECHKNHPNRPSCNSCPTNCVDGNLEFLNYFVYQVNYGKFIMEIIIWKNVVRLVRYFDIFMDGQYDIDSNAYEKLDIEYVYEKGLINPPHDIPKTFVPGRSYDNESGYEVVNHEWFIFEYDSKTNTFRYRIQNPKFIDYLPDECEFDDIDMAYEEYEANLNDFLLPWKNIKVTVESALAEENYYQLLGISNYDDLLCYDLFLNK